MKLLTKTAPTPTELLADRTAPGSEIHTDRHLWGFGGLHGGLALALAAAAMSRSTDVGDLRSVTGQYLRPLRGTITVDARPVRTGRTTQTVQAEIRAGGNAGLLSTATFGRSTLAIDGAGPAAPVTGGPHEYEPFAPPPEFVPISVFTDIRPVGPNLPYFGGDEAELTAWIRLADDDTPIDVPRLILLADALAPSYAAVLSDLVIIPTVELTVRPTGATQGASSPWALLRARSDAVSADGWIHETIDLWDLDRRHLGSAQQLRVLDLRSPAS